MLQWIKVSAVRCPVAIYLHRFVPLSNARIWRTLIDIIMLPLGLLYSLFLVVRAHLFRIELNDDTTQLAIAAIIKNERPYIVEWIEYHKLLGFSKFYIYDNESSDNVVSELEDYIQKGTVDYIPMPGVMRQCDAYNDALNRIGMRNVILAVLDLDEFLFPCKKPLPDLLNAAFSNSKVSCLCVNWCIFGSSGKRERPDGLVMENYLFRSLEDNEKNRHVKSICVPMKTAGFINPHFAVGLPGYHAVNSKGRRANGAIGDDVSIGDIRVNHYFTKSYAEFVNKKNRGKADDITQRSLEEFSQHDLNDVYDDSALFYARRLHNIIE